MEEKTIICHKGQEIESAGKGHEEYHTRHGDTLGPCEESEDELTDDGGLVILFRDGGPDEDSGVEEENSEDAGEYEDAGDILVLGSSDSGTLSKVDAGELEGDVSVPVGCDCTNVNIVDASIYVGIAILFGFLIKSLSKKN